MRVIKTGNTYRIYNNSMETYNELPAQSYQVCFNRGGCIIEGKDLKIEV